MHVQPGMWGPVFLIGKRHRKKFKDKNNISTRKSTHKRKQEDNERTIHERKD